MKHVNLPRPHRGATVDGLAATVADIAKKIEVASRDNDPQKIAQDFSITNYTETRSLNAGTATATDVANVLCTLIRDLQNGGSKR